MVRLTRIYTKTGDAGQTHLGDMSRVAKTDPRLVAFADVDETNSVARCRPGARRPGRRSPTCCAASRTTCSTSAPTCAPRARRNPATRPADQRRRTPNGSRRPATRQRELPTLTLHPARRHAPAALLHPARMVARRAERSVWALLAVDADRTNAETARYLNRLSDLLFILARAANPGGDMLWAPGAHSGAHAQRAQAETRHRTRRGRLHPGEEAGHCRAVHRQLPRGLRGRDGEDDDVAGQRQVVAAGAARASTRNSERTSRSWGRTESDSARYQSSVSPQYQATPTAQRAEPLGRSTW